MSSSAWHPGSSAAGYLTGNKKLESEGKRDEAKGKAEGVINDAKDQVKKVKDPFKPTDR